MVTGGVLAAGALASAVTAVLTSSGPLPIPSGTVTDGRR